MPNREKRQRAEKKGQNKKRLQNAQHSLKGGRVPWVVLRSPGALPTVPIFPPSIRVGPYWGHGKLYGFPHEGMTCHGILPV